MNKIFLTADLHLDHENIIKFCNRPFKSVNAMNKTLIHNWNKTVKDGDVVFLLGDLCFGKHKADYWLKQLNGTITFIGGNHDKSKSLPIFKQSVLIHEGQKFYLVHNPLTVPKNWDDWVIHGHMHNNDLENFPFINKEKKTVNVSVELTDYTPISIDKLFEDVLKQ